MPATVVAGGVRWRLRTGADPATVRPVLEAALAAVARGEAVNVKSGRRKELYPLALGRPAPPDFLLKRNRYPLAVALRRAGRGSRSRHELALAEALAARGLPVPVPLAAGERRRGPLLESCYLLVPVIDGAKDVLRLAQEDALAPAARRALAAALGALARRSHDAGLFQDDFAPNNFLVRADAPAAPLLIDFERARLRRRIGRGERRWMLAKLERALPFVAATERMRFLLAYTGGDRAEARAWWRELAAFVHTLGRRDRARLARLATRAGRRFAPLRVDGGAAGPWQGFARRDAPRELAQALAALAPPPPRDEGAAPAVVGGRRALLYTAVDRAAARELWISANWLASRALAPRPLALLHRRSEARLLLDAPADAPTPPAPAAAAAALRRLRARLAALGHRAPPPALDGVLWSRDPSGRPHAELLDPRGAAAPR